MNGKCRLCKEEKELAISHIVPKMFFNHIKKESITGGMRLVSDPNRRVEDGLKLPFLCHECELKFSRYEKYFSDKFFQPTKNNLSEKEQYDTADNMLKYFILSVAWRCLRYIYETDKEMLRSFTDKENLELEMILNHWRYILYEENLNEISKIQMYLIPTKKLSIFNNFPEIAYNNVGIDFRVLGKENTFQYAYQYVRVPYFILICTVWGEASNMEQFLAGKNILEEDSKLPMWLNRLIINHLEVFEKSKNLMSDKQKEKIINKVNKNKDKKNN